MMTVAVIMITVVFEVVTHAVDHYAAKQPHIFQIVQRVYKELMLLGIISFGLFFFETLACIGPEFTHELHVIHILIFFISIAYIAEAIFILYVAGAVARRWNKIEGISLMQYAALKLQLAAYSQRLANRNVVWRSLSWLLMYKQHTVRGMAAYQDARLQFVSCNRLPHDFDFALYLKRCIRTTFVDLLHIHWGIWMAVAMLVQLDVFITTSFIMPTRASVDTPGPVDLIDYLVAAGIVLTLWLSIIYWKVLQVQENCFKSDLMEFNVWEELMWMMQQQKLQKLTTDHQKGKRFIGKAKKSGPPTTEPAGIISSRRTPRKRNSLLAGFTRRASSGARTSTSNNVQAIKGNSSMMSTPINRAAHKPGAPLAEDGPASVAAPVPAPAARRSRRNQNGAPAHDEDSLISRLSVKAKQKDGEIVQNVQAKRRKSINPDHRATPRATPSQSPTGMRANNDVELGGGSGVCGGLTPARRKRPAIGAGLAPQGSQSSGMNLRKGSIVVGNKASITPQEYLEHVEAVRTAWRYAAAQTIHDIRLAKRMKKQKKYGHFSIEQWGRTSRVFEKFFWFHSHFFIQYFLQGAVFCTSIYFAVVMNFGGDYIFTAYNFEHKLPQIIVLLTCMCVVVFLGLFTLVPAILMQYTMVMHLAQTYEKDVVNDAVTAARALSKEERKGKGKLHDSKHEGVNNGVGEKVARPSCGARLQRLLTYEGFEEAVNSTLLMNGFLTLLIISFFITVLGSVVRQDQADYCVAECIPLCLDPSEVHSLPPAVVDALVDCLRLGQNATSAAVDEGVRNFSAFADGLETADIVIAYLFVVDVVLRLASSPRSFLSSPWDVFDALVVITYAVAAPFLAKGDGLGTVLVLRVLRVLRFHRFVYAMSASGSGLTGGPSRREQLVMCCQKQIGWCCRKHGDDGEQGEQWAPPPYVEDMGDDPIAAMKAKRAAARAAAPGVAEKGSGMSAPEMANCSA